MSGHLRLLRLRLHLAAPWTPAMCCWPSAAPTRSPTAPCGCRCRDDNTKEEVDYIMQAIGEVVAYLRSMSPMWRDLDRQTASK